MVTTAAASRSLDLNLSYKRDIPTDSVSTAAISTSVHNMPSSANIVGNRPMAKIMIIDLMGPRRHKTTIIPRPTQKRKFWNKRGPKGLGTILRIIIHKNGVIGGVHSL